MNTISESDIQPGNRVIIRSSLNVSLNNDGQIVDDLRLRRITDTIDIVISAGGMPILISHIKNDQGSTMKPVVNWFKEFGYNTILISDYYPFDELKNNFLPNTVYVFENLRDYPGEKNNEESFTTDLAKYGDVYINESFDAAHRAHASTVALPKLLPSFVGLNFAAEVFELSKVFEPDRPFTFIIGGAKIETKAPLIRKLLEKADKVFVGGALMNPLLAARGINVGNSKMPEVDIDVSDIAASEKLVLPIDFIDQNRDVVTIDQISDDTQLLDVGPDSTAQLLELISTSKLVVWNGPLGLYEQGYVDSTDAVAQTLSQSDCYSIIGGGDTLAAVDDAVEQGINWISTGGGAMLDFIESDGDLPAIKALQ